MNANTHLNSDPLHRDSAVARDPDSTIDRALSALRDAAPRPGLESRILSSLDHRTAAPQQTRFHISAHIALWTAASAAIIAIASLAILHHRATPMADESSASVRHVLNPVILSGASRSDAKSKDPETVSRATNSEPVSTTNLARITHTLSSRPVNQAVILSEAPQGSSRRTPVFENCSDHLHQGCPIHDDARVVVGGIAQTPTDAQALADLHTPSHPAPPLPLTPQERLFLRILRYGNATQLAELDPVVRAQHDAEETTEFKAFFPDPPPLKQPLGDTE